MKTLELNQMETFVGGKDEPCTIWHGAVLVGSFLGAIGGVAGAITTGGAATPVAVGLVLNFVGQVGTSPC